jgi:rare lipoprotein A
MRSSAPAENLLPLGFFPTLPFRAASCLSLCKRRIPWIDTTLSVGVVCLTMAFLMIAACAGVSRQEPGSSTQRGVASWYGPGFHGNPTANGERYNMWALTAAHRTLPFGTQIHVQSVGTGKSVIVRINDRGPFIRGRVIDLSYGAARELAMIGKGTEEVILTVIHSSSTGFSHNVSKRSTDNYWIQAGSFTTLTQAVSLREQLANKYPHVRLKTVNLPTGQSHRVQIGTFLSQEQANTVATELKRTFNLDPILIQDNSLKGNE